MRVLGATVGVLLFSLSLFSQGNFGRILGTVTDESGGVVSGATVTVLDTQRGVARTLTTDQAGEYSAPTLIPGDYTVRVEAKGFKRVDRQNVVLEVGKEVRVDLTVQPGDQAQTITVTEAAPLVETTNATLGGTLNNTDINDMPLNGRNFQNLLSLRPGVMMQAGGSPWSQSTNNIRPDETGWMMDGVINVSFYDDRPVGNSSSALTDAATIVPIDAIQEFDMQENPKAEYGWKPGAVVNVGIRSGTNTLHGSVYGYYRSQKWDARNVFTPAPVNGTCVQNTGVPAVCDKLPTQLKQFGAVVGGPIKKDKLFFLAGYEGLRDLIGNIFPFAMPVTGSLIGQPLPPACPTPADCSMVDAINALKAANVPLSQVSLNLLGCTTGAAPANTACTGGLIFNSNATSLNYTSTFPNVNSSDNGIGKIDYVINSKHRISGMFWTGYYLGTGQDHPTVNPLFKSEFIIHSLSTVENWIWTPSSTVVNEFRFGYDRLTNNAAIGDEGIIPDGSGGLCTATGCGGKGYPLNTGVTKGGGLPYISIGNFGGGLGNNNGGRPMGTGPSPYLDFQDSVSYLRGAHALKFGGELTHIEADQNTTDFRGIDINFNGALTNNAANVFSCPAPNPTNASCSTALEDYFAGNPNLGSVTVGNGNRKMVWWHYAGFVQDDWRIKPRLMLNLGLRYEYNQPLREVNNLLGNFDPNSSTGIVQQGQPGVGSTLWKPDHKDFSPRVGFAWDVTGKGTTVLRGGSSVTYTTLFARAFMDNGPQNGSAGNIAVDPSGACNTFVPAVPAGQTCASVGGKTFGGTIDLGQPTFTPAGGLNWSSTVPAFPQGQLSCTANATCTIYALDPHLKTPYMVNYNFGVQHSFGSNLSLDVSYVGNRGYNLLTQTDVNQCLLSTIVDSPKTPNLCKNNQLGGRPFFNKFPYLQIINEQTNAAHSNYNSLQATLTQRTSHGLDFTAGYTYGHGLDNGSLNFQGQTPQDSTHPEREYASGDFDIRHRLTVTAGYAIPGKKGYGQLLKGWKLNTIVTFQTAQPWLALDMSPTHDFSSGESGVGDLTDRWNITGNPADFRSGVNSIPFCSGPPDPITKASNCSQTSVPYGTSTPTPDGWSKCVAADAAYSTPATSTLTTAGCFVSRNGNSVLTPNALGTFGNMGRNIFRDSGYKNVDFSVFKDFKFRERFGAQFRWELFNIFNHPNIANPYGSSNTSFLGAKLNNSGAFGSGGSTPDVAAGNPLVGSGSSRVMQLGLKLTF